MRPRCGGCWTAAPLTSTPWSWYFERVPSRAPSVRFCPSFPVLARACLRRLGARMGMVTSREKTPAERVFNTASVVAAGAGVRLPARLPAVSVVRLDPALRGQEKGAAEYRAALGRQVFSTNGISHPCNSRRAANLARYETTTSSSQTTGIFYLRLHVPFMRCWQCAVTV